MMIAERNWQDREPVEDILEKAAIERCMKMKIPISLVDPSAEDSPLICVNQAFEDLTGYSAKMVTGMNCRFLQGDETDKDDVRVIADAIRAGVSVSKVLMNYCRDGTPFHNLVSISPLVVAPGRILLVGCQSRFDEYPLLQVARREVSDNPVKRTLLPDQIKALNLQYRALGQRSEAAAMFLRSHLVSSRLVLTS